ncbi:MAG TPA: hypothetical protein VI670_26250 [Thermoanaerobaculia bacterium]|jgi:hypothetical protein
MGIIWLSPGAYSTTDPALRIQPPSPARPTAVITCTTAGMTAKSISAALTLPPGAGVEEIIVCHQCSNDASFIAGIALLETTLPGTTVVRLDSAVTLKSTTPVCAPVSLTRFTPSGSVILELRLRFDNPAHEISFGGLGVRIGDNCSAARNDHLLGEYGPYADPTDAYKTFHEKAVPAILAEGGGVLCIPRDAPHGFFPRNKKETGRDAAAITIIDYRNGVEHTYVPPIGITSSEASAVSGRIIERDLALDLEWQNVVPAVSISSRLLGGPSSFEAKVARAVAGAGDRIYVPTLRGVYKGQKLLIDPRTAATQEVVTVKDMGLDGVDPYLVTDVRKAHPQGVQIYNKNDVGALLINDVSNCDNQSESLSVQRTTYGTGDSFGVSVFLTYQGNIQSAGGDEGGVLFGGVALHDVDSFIGEVEAWDKDSRVLKYKAGAKHPQKLGTSRPIINFNRGKQIEDGTVQVMNAGGGHTVVVGNAAASAKWSTALVGRFFALNDPTEYYPEAAGEPITHRKLRWWLITKIDASTAGAKKLFVERAITEAGLFTGPTLLRPDINFGRDLKYIIAPGAWASDVRDGVAGTIQGNIGAATAADTRTIVLAPSPTIGSADDFAAGDPITNPPGPDPWIPTGFRARHVHQFPSRLKGPAFLSENLGMVQVGPGVAINGKEADSTDLDAVRGRMKDHATEYESGITINAATDKGIVVRGAVATEVALELFQDHGNRKRIRWLDSRGFAAGALHVDPDDGRFILEGKGLDLTGRGTILQSGLSATRRSSSTLGRRSEDVAGAASSHRVTRLAEGDTEYTVFTTCSWQTTTVIANKKTTFFDVQFGTPAPTGGGTLDWFLVRLG